MAVQAPGCRICSLSRSSSPSEALSLGRIGQALANGEATRGRWQRQAEEGLAANGGGEREREDEVHRSWVRSRPCPFAHCGRFAPFLASVQSRMIRGRTLLRAFCCLSRRCPMAWRSRTLCVSGRQAADAISENWTPDEIRRLTIHRAGPGAAVASARVRRDEQHRVRSI